MADQLMQYVGISWLLWIGSGLLVHAFVYWRQYLPSFTRDVYEYGKLRSESDWSWISPSVPKRWFTHFYVWGVVWNYSVFLYYTSHCLLHTRLPLLGPAIETVIGNFVSSKCNYFSQAHLEVWLVLLLVCLQVSRRLFECLFVSVFSDSKMAPVHYILGVYFYTALGPTALLHLNSDSPLSTATTLAGRIKDSLHWYHIVATLLFLWAYTHQYRCHVILAQLRAAKNKPQYGLPTGDWFQYVSSPHFFAEMVMYFALSLCQAVTNLMAPMWLVFLCTTCVLTVTAKQTHVWYRDKFEDYPNNRKIIIPFVY